MDTVLPDNIETLYKADLPFEAIEGGHGYAGVVLYDRLADKLQCHICGGWYAHLASHIYGTHKMLARDYKMEYGLPLGQALVSRDISSRISNAAVKQKRHLQLQKKDKKRRRNHRKSKPKRIAGARYGKHCSAFHNKKAICDLQLQMRFDVAMDILATDDPSANDIRKYDSLLFEGIKTRYRTLNNFKRHFGYVVNREDRKRHNYDETKLIAALRKFYFDKRRVPMQLDFTGPGIPSYATIKNHFGSWRRALEVSLGPERIPPDEQRIRGWIL